MRLQNMAHRSILINWARPADQTAAGSVGTVWKVSFDYGPHMTDTVEVNASSEEEAIDKVKTAHEKNIL